MIARGVIVLCAAWLALHELRTLVAPELETAVFTDRHAHVAVLAFACTALFALAWERRGERLAWLLLAGAATSWSLGEAWYVVAMWDLPTDEITVPSPADIAFLGLYPLAASGIVLLLRARAPKVNALRLVDGLVASLAVAALSAAVVMEDVLVSISGGKGVEFLTLLAYPLGDLVLIGMAVGAMAMLHWRLSTSWLLVVAGFCLFWVTDSRYLLGLADGSFVNGGPWDAGWWVLPVLLGVAASRPSRAVAHRVDADVAGRTVVAPLAFAVFALGILVWASLGDVHASAVGLAAASLLAVMVRLALTFGAHAAMVRRSRHEALTDSLTGLGNRRALVADLDTRLAAIDDGGDDVALVLFDLDGFKAYNDAFGHPAGDALLVRLGARLRDVMPPEAGVYRMGGDEFCALLPAGGDLVERAAFALSEKGGSFTVGCSYGVVCIPSEATQASEALRLADGRMYAHKRQGRISAGSQSKDVLVRALAERDPVLHLHLADVAGLAAGVALAMGLEGEEAQRVRLAAELHDVGKVAIPDAILLKPGPLTDEEWTFVHQHTLIGERIVAAAPALEHVAALVRASHERWDGTGYPDRTAGDAIPLGARIVGVCDAFDAMVAERPYRRALTSEAALEELRRCAGSQFDPAVVAAFAAAWSAREDALDGASGDPVRGAAGDPSSAQLRAA